MLLECLPGWGLDSLPEDLVWGGGGRGSGGSGGGRGWGQEAWLQGQKSPRTDSQEHLSERIQPLQGSAPESGLLLRWEHTGIQQRSAHSHCVSGLALEREKQGSGPLGESSLQTVINFPSAWKGQAMFALSIWLSSRQGKDTLHWPVKPS